MICIKLISRPKAGFTLLELLSVVAVIGVLAAVAIPKYMNYTTVAKYSVIKDNFEVLSQMEGVYYNNNHAFYPENGSLTIPYGESHVPELGVDFSGENFCEFEITGSNDSITKYLIIEGNCRSDVNQNQVSDIFRYVKVMQNGNVVSTDFYMVD